jgi:hypothetical protein
VKPIPNGDDKINLAESIQWMFKVLYGAIISHLGSRKPWSSEQLVNATTGFQKFCQGLIAVLRKIQNIYKELDTALNTGQLERRDSVNVFGAALLRKLCDSISTFQALRMTYRELSTSVSSFDQDPSNFGWGGMVAVVRIYPLIEH